MGLINLDATITIAFSVTDRHATAAWYSKMLGFEALYHADEVGWSELHSNVSGVTIGLGEATEVTKGNCVPVFGTADLDAARAKLEAVGVRFDGPTEVIDGMVKTVTFYDPDDNALMMAQDLTKG